MPLIAQICIVVVTLAVVWLAVVAIKLIRETNLLIETAKRSLVELPALIQEIQKSSARADELLRSFSKISHAAQTVVNQVESLSTRTSAMANVVLDEVEQPISKVVGVMQGIRSGADFLARRWTSRLTRRTHTNPGDDHVGEQRWLDDGGIPARSTGGSWSGSAGRPDGR